jgi:acyl-CoA reductase-like NAD-dependent aldehyde dehydrogenase
MTTLTAGPTAVGSLKSIDPATGHLVGEAPVTPVEKIAAVVERARQAQTAWCAMTVDDRAKLVLPAGRKLVERVEALGVLLTNEMGKPLNEAMGEVRNCGETLERTLAEIVEALRPEPFEDERVSSHVHYDPFGVCAAITPWNFPLSMPHWIVVPALVAGNTVVLKPSEETPIIAQAYVDLLNEVLPEGVLQIIHGADEQGKALVSADVDLVAFTGSREAGKHILGAASGSLKRVILELGGKDPMIVLDDADVSKAAEFAASNSFRNAGQVCVSTERIYVDERIADAFERELAQKATEMKVGAGTQGDTQVGPMINERQRDHVLRQVDDAVSGGATVAAGGEGHHDNFIMPTVLTGVTHDMDIMREETFGPVACVMRFKHPDDAIRLANDTPFGLGAAVFGGDVTRAADVARRLSAGMVGVNKGCGGASGTPWVGAGQSGYGYHSGRDGHRQFCQPRVVSVPKT